MSKQLIVDAGFAVMSFDISRVTRAGLYGTKKRVPIGRGGGSCQLGNLTEDGALLADGMSTWGRFDEHGVWFAASDTAAVGPGGEILEKKSSTLGQVQALEEATLRDVLDIDVESVYALSCEEGWDGDIVEALAGGKVYSMEFRYRAGTKTSHGLLVANKEGQPFLLVGAKTNPEWVGPFTETLTKAQDDDIDFLADLDFAGW